MKRVLLIYNPVAGEGVAKSRLDSIVKGFQNKGFSVITHITDKENNLQETIKDSKTIIDLVAIAGGDGTINKTINGLFYAGVWDIPFGIIPIGTSNDMADYYNIPSKIEDAVSVITQGKTKPVDIGEINGEYFINVASGGLMTEVPHKTNVKFKNIAGKLAYYIKGLEQIPNVNPFSVVISTPEKVIKEKILLFIVLNGTTAGGFKNLAPHASMNDGKFDLIVFKAANLSKLPRLFLKILKSEHLNDPSLIYFQTKGPIIIECSRETSNDVDGEKGPGFPMEIKMHPAKFSIICS